MPGDRRRDPVRPLTPVGTVRRKEGVIVKLMECSAGHGVIVEQTGQTSGESGD